MQLKDYQNTAIKKLLSRSKELLAQSGEKKVIFKQAIALGWDCPRAQVLVLFRDWKSLTFSVQTVGRIMRMPEPDKGHYKQELLNHGYVYTNLADIEIKEDMARSYVTIYTSNRIENYKPIKLDSVYRLRQREKTRLSTKFINIFLDEAKAYNLEKKKLPVALYIFSWGKNEYKGEYSSQNIRVEDIPEPILEVYKELNRP